MVSFYLSRPTAFVSRGIENLVISQKTAKSWYKTAGCFALSRLISITVFPLFTFLEMTFKRIPKVIATAWNGKSTTDKLQKVGKFFLGTISSVTGLHSPEGVSGYFLKRASETAIRPFGVEEQYGKKVDTIAYPKTAEELQSLVQEAKTAGKQISVIGAGFSQGTQTIPKDSHQVVINTKHLNDMQLASDGKTVTVGSGTTWEKLQLYLNERGKSSLVKQASDPFSIGGSIGINCHGWAHEAGAIASTVEELTIINSNGDLQTLTPDDELFGAQFGTFGYFGIIVSAKLRVVDNTQLLQSAVEIPTDQFVTHYNTHIKDHDVPLFIGRLNLDHTQGDPLRSVCMVRYDKDNAAEGHLDPSRFKEEPKRGNFIERAALKCLTHLSNTSAKGLLHTFWERHKKKLLKGESLTRNEALHPPINALKMLTHSNLHTQWLQEYFIAPENLSEFIRFLSAKLKENNVRLVNATIRPTPKDTISILPYAEKDRHAVVLCFAQEKTPKAFDQTIGWINEVNEYLLSKGDLPYQAYMPFTSREDFDQFYGAERVERMRALKDRYDPTHLFGNEHTAKYFDRRT